MRRRQFLVLSAASVGGVLVYSLDRQVSRVSAQDKPATQQQIKIPLRFLTESEALIVAAAVSRIFPSDESGPGAQEAGVTVFIDRQLAGPWGRDRHRYTHPPFDETVFTAPTSRASGVNSSSSGITAVLCGIVTEKPAIPIARAFSKKSLTSGVGSFK